MTERRSLGVPWIAVTSGAIVALASGAAVILDHRAARGELGLTDVIGLVVLTCGCVWIRFPLLSLVAAIVLAFVPSLQEQASVGVLVFSHSLLARTRFFASPDARVSDRFAATASGWLTVASLVLWNTVDNGLASHHNGGEQTHLLSLPAVTLAIALGFGVMAIARRQSTKRRGLAELPHSESDSLALAFFVGGGSLILGVGLMIAGLIIPAFSGATSGSAGQHWGAPAYYMPSATPAPDSSTSRGH